MNGTLPQQMMMYLMKIENEERNTRIEIARELGKPLCVVSRAGEKIIQRGWATKQRKYTPETDRWRDAYNLTSDGVSIAMEIKEVIG